MDRQTALARARELVSRMTLEEAASQLRFDAPAIPRLGIPAYNWWNEALHGVARAGTATSFPQAIGMAAAFDPALLERVGEVVSTEGRAKYNAASAHGDRDIYKGLTFWSPNINIFRDPRWGRGHETYGEDPVLTVTLGCAYVRGLQGRGETLRAAACAKHFAVHSGPEGERHRFNAVASQKDLAETYLYAFRALVREARVEAVMGAYNRTNGEPCCASPALMRKLREEWGFEGHFVSDCWAVRDFHENHHVTRDAPESAALAVNAGCDVNCGCTYRAMMEAYERGLVSEEVIRRACVRLFTTRYRLGLLEGSEYDSIPYTVVECPEHLALAQEAARKSCVLLKNNGLLPLDKTKIRTIGVIGPNADSRQCLIGNYHGTSSRYITLSEGIQDEVGDEVRVLYSEGCHLWRENVEGLAQTDDRCSEALTVAENSDVVVLALGLDETLEGEEGDAGSLNPSGDKTSLLLPESQRILARQVLSVGKPTVIVLLAGSAVDLEQTGEDADAVLLGWYPGARGGRAIADILFGKVSPSGKLPITFYRNEQLERLPAFTDYAMEGRTYRYFREEPLYPFGYGLTYGDVTVESASCTREGETLRVRAELTNGGGRDTEEVVQVYARNEGSELAPVNPRLVGFARVWVPAGGTCETEISVEEERLRVFDREGKPIREGRLVLYVGTGQPDRRTMALTGKRGAIIN